MKTEYAGVTGVLALTLLLALILFRLNLRVLNRLETRTP